MTQELEQLRAQIDAVDDRLLDLLNQRAQLAQAVGHVKGGAVVYRPEREAQVLRRLQAANPGPLPNAAIRLLFQEVMSACRALERPLTVAYLGPQGTFSEAAALKHFGHAAETHATASIDDVFREVEAGHADYGVVPVENTTGGAVGTTLDLLQQTPLKICSEIDLRVHQCLLRRPDAQGPVTRVYSHAQSLSQCHEWLNQNLPGAERVPVTSNTEAARLAAQDPTATAIAAAAAAAHYGLAILAENIEDRPDNTTRFLVLGKEDAAPSGRDKTSLVLSTPNRPGSLLELLEPFAAHKVGLSKLESRPAKSGNWEYVFFIDIEGHRSQPQVAEALNAVQSRASLFRILGSYPAAV